MKSAEFHEIQQISQKASYGSVRNKASPSDNDWLQLFRTDWFEILSDKCTLQ